MLFKFDVPSEKYEVAAPNVTPELTDDGDDEASWILEVSERSSDLNIRFLAPLNPRASVAARGATRTFQILRPPSQILTSWHPLPTQVGDVSCPVSDQCRLVSNHQAIRIDSSPPALELRAPTQGGFAAFTDAYRDAF